MFKLTVNRLFLANHVWHYNLNYCLTDWFWPAWMIPTNLVYS